MMKAIVVALVLAAAYAAYKYKDKIVAAYAAIKAKFSK